MRALLLVPLLAACAVSGPHAAAQTREAGSAPGSAIVVLDGSGSMGGPLEGQKDVKFDMVSQALLKLLPNAAPQSKTGLVTFGNRRKGDCSDVDVVIPPASSNLDQFTAVFGKIGPTGKGPLVAGVRGAAKALPPDAPGTMIVIHDDADNCRQDVCALASELAQMSPKVTVHVVTISLEKATVDKMSCLASTTGGRQFQAQDAASVESSIAEALRIARIIGPSAEPSGPAPVPPAGAAAAAGPPSVRLSAGLSSSGEALTTPVAWRLIGPEPAQTIVKEATSINLTGEIAAGTYTVEARSGLASGRAKVEVADHGQTQARVSLEAANLRVTALAGKTPDQLAEPVLTISAVDKAASTVKHVFVGHQSQADLVLPAGAYRISATDGLSTKQQDITLAPGDTTPVDFALNTGRLELSAVNRDGGDPLEGALFVISVDDPDAPQGRREIARSIAPRPAFILAAGTYYVTATLGSASTRERVALGTGDVVKRPIPLNGAWLGLTASIDQALVPKESPVVFRILAADSKAREVTRINAIKGSSTAEVFLPQGSYRIEAAAGHLNVKGSAEANVTAGPKTAVTVGVAASELTLVPPAAGVALAAWDLRDGQGHVVQRSTASNSAKTLLVAPGRYLVRIEAGEVRSEKPLDLKAGEKRVLPLTAD